MSKIKTYTVEIHRKGGSVPLIQHGLSLFAADRLYRSAPHRWTLRRIIQDGVVIKEEFKFKTQLRYGIPPKGSIVIV